jgi:hypothetical protein
MPRVRDEIVLEDPRAQKLADWINRTGRKLGWVAEELGYSKVWISYIVNGHQPMSDNVAYMVQLKFGIDMGMGPLIPEDLAGRRS